MTLVLISLYNSERNRKVLAHEMAGIILACELNGKFTIIGSICFTKVLYEMVFTEQIFWQSKQEFILE